jgi:hypothetical protein
LECYKLSFTINVAHRLKKGNKCDSNFNRRYRKSFVLKIVNNVIEEKLTSKLLGEWLAQNAGC